VEQVKISGVSGVVGMIRERFLDMLYGYSMPIYLLVIEVKKKINIVGCFKNKHVFQQRIWFVILICLLECLAVTRLSSLC